MLDYNINGPSIAVVGSTKSEAILGALSTTDKGFISMYYGTDYPLSWTKGILADCIIVQVTLSPGANILVSQAYGPGLGRFFIIQSVDDGVVKKTFSVA